MEKEFTVKEFVDGYNNQKTNSLKAKYIENIKVEAYVDYITKRTVATNIVECSTYKIDSFSGDRKQFYVNTANRTLYVAMNLIQWWTNININMDDLVTDYDLLNRNGLIPAIIEKISDEEVIEFRSLVEMIGNDEYMNYNSPIAFIERQIENISMLLINTLREVDSIDDLSTTETANLISTKIKNFIEKE